ncbi:hypothetical protein PoB_005903000 [Plakobranchus ocellatus]|uniref:Polycystin cation channel PKD1/PKD2 domain-containing protein n=1 Tax=Plakobranchus ocellatus TaxID=259542 RepID=A0AAV4CKV3_9GAST|nr:hypothetical protein PoB_005903000 [Plakobranchus ocellatus]
MRKKVKFYYAFRNEQYFDFTEMAAMDELFKIGCGFLAFTCIFQILVMLSKIRRLLVFIRLLQMALYLFFMPLVTGMGFTFLAFLWFGSGNDFFSNFRTSYLNVNQYFIKPRAIYHVLNDNNPYLGPTFLGLLGFVVCFFVVNFFIVFLNEAYTFILLQIRIENYKVREKTKLEIIYEFLGIQTITVWDDEEDLLYQEKAEERKFIVDIKKLRGN